MIKYNVLNILKWLLLVFFVWAHPKFGGGDSLGAVAITTINVRRTLVSFLWMLAHGAADCARAVVDGFFGARVPVTLFHRATQGARGPGRRHCH
mgnify:CR=1 FL=1